MAAGVYHGDGGGKAMSCQCKTDKQRAKCVWWVGPEAGFLQVNDATGEQRLATGCFPQLALEILRYVVKATNGSAAAVESTRNVIAEGFGRVAETMVMIGPHNGKLLDAPPERQ